MMTSKPRGDALSEYRIFETDELVRALEKLPADQARFIHSKLLNHAYPQLRQMPFHGANIRKLRGFNPPTWRYRIGQYRMYFHVDDTKRIVYVLAVENRKDAYR